MSHDVCFKCGNRFNPEIMTRIHLEASDVYLCPICMEVWEKIYYKWKNRNMNNPSYPSYLNNSFWIHAWKEFIGKNKVKKKFNPSVRGSG
jgi:hypothetical protein